MSNRSANITRGAPHTKEPQADHVTTSSKLCNTGRRVKEPASVSSALRQKKNFLYFYFLLDFVHSFRVCLYTTCFVQFHAAGLLSVACLFLCFKHFPTNCSFLHQKLYFCLLHSILSLQHMDAQPQYCPQCLPGL